MSSTSVVLIPHTCLVCPLKLSFHNKAPQGAVCPTCRLSYVSWWLWVEWKGSAYGREEGACDDSAHHGLRWNKAAAHRRRLCARGNLDGAHHDALRVHLARRPRAHRCRPQVGGGGQRRRLRMGGVRLCRRGHRGLLPWAYVHPSRGLSHRVEYAQGLREAPHSGASWLLRQPCVGHLAPSHGCGHPQHRAALRS